MSSTYQESQYDRLFGFKNKLEYSPCETIRSSDCGQNQNRACTLKTLWSFLLGSNQSRFPGYVLHYFFTRTTKRRYIGQQPGKKSGRRPADKPLVNRGFCSSIDLHRISYVRASDQSFRTVVPDALGKRGVGCPLGEPTRRRPVLPGPVPPRRAPPRRDPPVVYPGLASTNQFPGYALHEKIAETKRRRSTGQQPGTKSGRRPADKPLIKRSFCSSIGFLDILGMRRVCRDKKASVY